MAVLRDLSMTPEMANELAMLRAENARLKAQAQAKNKLTMKITEKGGISVYGMGRFPVTLYAGQWQRLAAVGAELLEFIEANRDKLSWKD